MSTAHLKMFQSYWKNDVTFDFGSEEITITINDDGVIKTKKISRNDIQKISIYISLFSPSEKKSRMDIAIVKSENLVVKLETKSETLRFNVVPKLAAETYKVFSKECSLTDSDTYENFVAAGQHVAAMRDFFIARMVASAVILCVSLVLIIVLKYI